ncbi:PREDICTED: uncharacterized protein LOC105315812, partial [Amphimedon queenslandica]|uniref:Uncharacterized protein n=1 Tax=Amphimedon queenslandica TaxID=400682 RepID=A0AAN0IS66_AMPQE
MESCVRFSLSPIVSRAPFLSSSTSKTLASTGQKQVFEFLEKRRLQYIVRQVKMKSSTAAKQQKEGGAGESSGGELAAPIQAGRYRLCLEKEPDKFAEHIVVKAKANIKTKRKRRKRQSPPPPSLQSRTTMASISEQSRPQKLTSTPRLNSSSSTHQHQISILSDQSLTSTGGVSSTTRHSISRDQDLVRQLYYSPLYQQVRREWRDTIAHKQ